MLLPHPASLGTLIPEGRCQVINPYRLGKACHPMFYVCTAYGSGTFRTQGEGTATTVFKSIHFFFYDIGAFTNPT
jgi:hypothetical protein